MILKKSLLTVLLFATMFVLLSCRTQKQSRGIVIAAAGDLVVARSLDAVTKEHGDEYPFLKIKDHLDKADIAFANLESVVADNAKIRSKDPKKINYNAPSSVMGVLVKSGFDVFSIANNHIFDLGKKGLSEFRGLLDKTGLHYGGAGKNLRQASKPIKIKVKGLETAFLNYNSAGGLNFCAKKKKAGYNCLPLDDKERSLKILAGDLKKIKNSDYKILSIHWGDNYKTAPTQEMKEIARAAIDMGFDLILGHSAHLFHGIEIYKGKPILYDMGDIFLRKSGGWDTRSFIFNINVKNGKTESIELFPTYIKNNQVLFAQGEIAKENIKRMVELSKQFNTEMKVEGERAVIDIISN